MLHSEHSLMQPICMYGMYAHCTNKKNKQLSSIHVSITVARTYTKCIDPFDLTLWALSKKCESNSLFSSSFPSRTISTFFVSMWCCQCNICTFLCISSTFGVCSHVYLNLFATFDQSAQWGV